MSDYPSQQNNNDTIYWLIALGLLGLSYLKLVSGSFNPFIYFQF